LCQRAANALMIEGGGLTGHSPRRGISSWLAAASRQAIDSCDIGHRVGSRHVLSWPRCAARFQHRVRESDGDVMSQREETGHTLQTELSPDEERLAHTLVSFDLPADATPPEVDIGMHVVILDHRSLRTLGSTSPE